MGRRFRLWWHLTRRKLVGLQSFVALIGTSRNVHSELSTFNGPLSRGFTGKTVFGEWVTFFATDRINDACVRYSLFLKNPKKARTFNVLSITNEVSMNCTRNALRSQIEVPVYFCPVSEHGNLATNEASRFLCRNRSFRYRSRQ